MMDKDNKLIWEAITEQKQGTANFDLYTCPGNMAVRYKDKNRGAAQHIPYGGVFAMPAGIEYKKCMYHPKEVWADIFKQGIDENLVTGPWPYTDELREHLQPTSTVGQEGYEDVEETLIIQAGPLSNEEHGPSPVIKEGDVVTIMSSETSVTYPFHNNGEFYEEWWANKQTYERDMGTIAAGDPVKFYSNLSQQTFNDSSYISFAKVDRSRHKIRRGIRYER